jgi:hypothetical protein
VCFGNTNVLIFEPCELIWNLIVKQVSDSRVLGASSLHEKEDEVTSVIPSAPASVATSPAPMFTCDYPECNAVSLE